METLHQQFAVAYSYPVAFTRGAFDDENDALAGVLRPGCEKPRRVVAFVDSNVLEAFPDVSRRIEAFCARRPDLVALASPVAPVPGGEACKADGRVVGAVQALIERSGLCRQSFVLAVGGGAVLDAVGYAAATAHRGVRLVRLPTTVLGQNDAGVGVKNGINAFGKKNFLGTFAPPFAVVNDFAFLAGLPPRELRAGIAEAVKVALIRDRAFFDALHGSRRRLAAFEPEALEGMIQRCAELHLRHIGTGGDPFENGSARPLDFGHWSAHRLEELTSGELRHGEAVAIGVALDAVYCGLAGTLAGEDVERVLATLEDVGFRLYDGALERVDPAPALEAFRQHLGGELSVTLLRGIGESFETGRLDFGLVGRAVRLLAERDAAHR